MSRKRMWSSCSERLKLRLAETTFCTDNAAMIGILAERKLMGGADGTSLDADILPGWTLGESCTVVGEHVEGDNSEMRTHG